MPERVYTIDPVLEQYSTPRQWEILMALQDKGSERRAAISLGVDKSYISQIKKAVLKKAAQHGYSPDHDMIHCAPDGYVVKGTSTLYDVQTGNAKIQWVKTDIDKERQAEIQQEAVAALCRDIPPASPIKSPRSTRKALCNLYTVSDFHMGMLAWHREGGVDWDLKIAKRVLMGCFKEMVKAAPDADMAIVNQLGDFLHSDGLLPLTPTGGNVLDQDGRFSKIVGATIECLRGVVSLALTKHRRVHVILAEGNHDPASSIWLRQMFSALYEKEPRVTVDDSVLPYYAFQHGKTALFFHHGHLKKMAGLSSLFAAEFPVMWGATTKRYGHCGHLHHVHIKEDAGITITQHPTLSARDAYAARGGWHAERQALCITYHDVHGQVATNNVTPEMLE
jgi:hypothetical protein